MRHTLAADLLASALVVTTLASVALVLADPVEDFITGNGYLVGLGTLLSLPQSLASTITGTMINAGYLGVFSLMLLESVSLPIPSEVILPFAGYMVSIGRIELWLTIVLATVAGVLGSLVDYYIGVVIGKKITSIRGSRFFISPSQMHRVESLFEQHGSKLIFASRLVPGLRTLASFPAGTARMKLHAFIIFTTAGCLLYNSILVYAGDLLGSNWDVLRSAGTLDITATFVVLIASAAILLRMHRESVAPDAPSKRP